MATSEWERKRRQEERDARVEKMTVMEPVEITEENVRQIAKKTGRSEYQLRTYLAEAREKGQTCVIRLPSE